MRLSEQFGQFKKKKKRYFNFFSLISIYDIDFLIQFEKQYFNF